jgi:hypothetical protein
MSVDLFVFVGRVPKNLRDRWQDAMAAQGLICEFRPDFDPATWGGSDLIARMQVRAGAFAGAERYGEFAFITGCGMDLHRAPKFEDDRSDLMDQCPKAMKPKLAKAPQMCIFSTSMGRSPDSWRFQLFAAATLAQVTSGLFFSPEDGTFHNGEEALGLAAVGAAEMESRMATKLKSGKGWAVRPFKTWRAALKDSIPEYAEA